MYSEYVQKPDFEDLLKLDQIKVATTHGDKEEDEIIFLCKTDPEGKSQFAIAYNLSLKRPDWTAHRLTSNRVKLLVNRNQIAWAQDEDIRSTKGWDQQAIILSFDPNQKGHLVPAADMGGSLDASQQTFQFTNAVAHRAGANQRWNFVEEWARSLVGRKVSHLFIITGAQGITGDSPAGHFVKAYIPLFLYKIVFDETAAKAIAVIAPNTRQDFTWYGCACSVKDVETLTGLTFLYGLLDEKKKSVDLAHWGDNLMLCDKSCQVKNFAYKCEAEKN